MSITVRERQDPARGGLVIDPAQHEPVPDGPYIEACRNRTGIRELFVYRHRITGAFVIAAWIVKPRVFGQDFGACSELCCISAPPDHHPPDLPSIESIAHICRPFEEKVKDRRRAAHEREYERLETERYNEESRISAAKHAKKHGDLEQFNILTSGCAPFIGDDEETKRVEEVLSTGRKVISHA